MRWVVGLLLSTVVVALPVPPVNGTQEVGERLLLDNEHMTVVEYIFPPGFRGEEHAAIANELAYVLEGEFAVVTRGRDKRVVRKGEVEFAAKGTIHLSVNETRKPARVLVVLLKER
ncbi:MAG: cupin domain-containing protein [Candidatus Rokubacteria bacterium]|nr:cupin domain-containing protein [Candidatus Rokubacteria bacterium]